MAAMKAYGSRALNEHGLDDADRRRWARHRSTPFYGREMLYVRRSDMSLTNRATPWRCSRWMLRQQAYEGLIAPRLRSGF